MKGWRGETWGQAVTACRRWRQQAAREQTGRERDEADHRRPTIDTDGLVVNGCARLHLIGTAPIPSSATAAPTPKSRCPEIQIMSMPRPEQGHRR